MKKTIRKGKKKKMNGVPVIQYPDGWIEFR